MSESQQVNLDSALLEYLLRGSEALPSVVADALERAEQLGKASMQVSPDQAVLLRFLLRLIGAKKVLEIGTFLGLSALVMAEAVGPDGRILCLDKSEPWADEARALWDRAGVSDRVELRIGDAHQTLDNVTDTFDVVFIDADKGGYLDYLRQVTPRLRSGGLLMVDNTLWYGRVTDEDDLSDDTAAIRSFNDELAAHADYHVAMVAVGDGLTLARKR